MDVDDSRAKYRQIADNLRAQIRRGILPPGDLVPSEASIVRTWKVARPTARAALDELERTGAVSGRPLRVTRHEPETIHVSRTADLVHPGESPTAGADDWVGAMQRAGRVVDQWIQVGIEVPGTDVITRLELAVGMTVISRRLTRSADGVPHNLITFWFPHDVAEGTLLAEPGSIREGSVAWLEKTYGPLQHEAEVTSRPPEPYEEGQLRIPPGWPVLVVWRVSRSSERPVVTSMAAYPADRTRLKIYPGGPTETAATT